MCVCTVYLMAVDDKEQCEQEFGPLVPDWHWSRHGSVFTLKSIGVWSLGFPATSCLSLWLVGPLTHPCFSAVLPFLHCCSSFTASKRVDLNLTSFQETPKILLRRKDDLKELCSKLVSHLYQLSLEFLRSSKCFHSSSSISYYITF